MRGSVHPRLSACSILDFRGTLHDEEVSIQGFTEKLYKNSIHCHTPLSQPRSCFAVLSSPCCTLKPMLYAHRQTHNWFLVFKPLGHDVYVACTVNIRKTHACTHTFCSHGFGRAGINPRSFRRSLLVWRVALRFKPDMRNSWCEADGKIDGRGTTHGSLYSVMMPDARVEVCSFRYCTNRKFRR